jgi:olefin beta-lactone synthetase
MFVAHAAKNPFQTAVVVPAGRDKCGRSITVSLSFGQLNRLSDQYAHGLTAAGFKKGERVLMMLRPGIDLIAVALSLLKMGSIPVMIDPGMGLKAFAQCVAETEPTGFIGIPQAQILRFVFHKAFKTVKRTVTAGKSRLLPGLSLDEMRATKAGSFKPAQNEAEEEAVVAFTSGGTGIPKGVVFLHGMIMATIESLRDDLNMTAGEIHLAAFYAFALFMPALGVTTIIPDMDPRKTAGLNPAYLVEAIETYGVTNSMGSPIIWEKIADYCIEQGVHLPSIKHVFMFGAEVPPGVVARFSALLDNGKVYTPYGATEALPLTNIAGSEIVAETEVLTAKGAGVCVGKPIAGAMVKIITITDDPIAEWDDSLMVPTGEMGEITAIGPTITRTYLRRPEKTAEAKINSAVGIWHRMGDIGYLDEKGRIWICGRKMHRVETTDGLLTPVQCETIYNQHPKVKRTALVGVGTQGRQRPVILVEPHATKQPGTEADKKELVNALLDLGGQHDHTRNIKDIFIYDGAFPVDVRHNTKIQRHKLIDWARKQLK